MTALAGVTVCPQDFPSLPTHDHCLLLWEGSSHVHLAGQGWPCLAFHIHLPDLRLTILPPHPPRCLGSKGHYTALVALVEKQHVLGDLEREQVSGQVADTR